MAGHVRTTLIILYAFLSSCVNREIDGIPIKKFNDKREYFKEGRYHALGQENRKKSIPAAKYYLKEALKLAPADHVTISLLGSIYRSSDQPDIEEKLYYHSLKKKPGDVRLMYILGKFYLSQKKYKLAKKVFKRCTSSKKTPFLPCYTMLATTYTKCRQFDRAIKTYESQIKYYKTSFSGKRSDHRKEKNPGLGTIHVRMAELYLNKKDYDRALKNSSKARHLIPRNWPAYRKASELLSRIEVEINNHNNKKIKKSVRTRIRRKKIFRRKKRHK